LRPAATADACSPAVATDRPPTAVGADSSAAAGDACPSSAAALRPAATADACSPAVATDRPPTAVGADSSAAAGDARPSTAATTRSPATATPARSPATATPTPSHVPATAEASRRPTAPALPPNPPPHTHTLHGTDDLPEALTTTSLPTATPWRAHFHVPLHTSPAPPLTSTLSVLRDALAHLMAHPSGHPLTHHLEVETYTWQALPPELRPRTRAQLADGIAAELTLARDLLTDLGLKELP
ncbi:hypothetical protein AB0D18_08680, partial [Streptomyces sp. NPDC048442]